MIVITLSDDGTVAFVHDVEQGKKPVDVSDRWVINQLMVEDKDGRKIAGFHIGKDVTGEVEEAVAAATGATEPEAEFLGDGK